MKYWAARESSTSADFIHPGLNGVSLFPFWIVSHFESWREFFFEQKRFFLLYPTYNRLLESQEKEHCIKYRKKIAY